MTTEQVISADSHVLEPFDLWEKALGARYGDRVPHLIRESNGAPSTRLFCGKETVIVDELVNSKDSGRIEALKLAGKDPAAREKLLDEDGVAAEVLNATWALYAMRMDDPQLRQACCSVFNDWLAEFCRHNPRRFYGVAMVPVDDVAWGVRELERVAKKGLRGVMIHTVPPQGVAPYRDTAYTPFWSALEACGMPLTLHIITGRVRDPFTFYGADIVERPAASVELSDEVKPILARDFIFGGVFDRHPKLRVITSEYEASWVPMFRFKLNRIQRYDGLAKLKRPAREYLDQVYLGIINDPYAAKWREEIGVSQIVWGSDFPHPSSTYPDTRQVLDRILDGVTSEDRRKIVSENAKRLYAIE
jgi:predicted TIM-barrel fold metal-dependent hydrolase